mgnify:FL=1
MNLILPCEKVSPKIQTLTVQQIKFTEVKIKRKNFAHSKIMCYFAEK